MTQYLTNEEINEIAINFNDYQKKYLAAKKESERNKYSRLMEECITKLKFLVFNRTSRYRQFSNFQDLEQDGFEGLMLALHSYNPNKGAFSWWAEKYIKTKISRCANNHSVFRIPIKQARLTKPHWVDHMPYDEAIDNRTPESCTMTCELNSRVIGAITQLKPDLQKIVNLTFGLNGINPHNITMITERLKITRSQYSKLLKEANTELRKIISD